MGQNRADELSRIAVNRTDLAQDEVLRWVGLQATLAPATPTSRKRGKSLSRRRGQNGYIEKAGRLYTVRYWKDVAGQDNKRHLVRERICPIKGPGSLSKSEIKRRAKEIIQASGVDTAEFFAAVVKPNPTGVTFRKQSEVWLQNSQSRKRNPIGSSYAVTIQGALDKWILPVIGDLPLGSVDNLTVKPLIDKMTAAGLSARTVNKYVEFVQQVVASLKAANGEPIHRRAWDAETMDLPIAKHAEQKRPSLKADTISKLIQKSGGQEQALYVLLASTGMRISEALALETRHFVNNGRTIVIEQQVEKDAPRIVRNLKTEAAKREIDLHSDIAEYLQRYAAGKSGLGCRGCYSWHLTISQATRNDSPFLQGKCRCFVASIASGPSDAACPYKECSEGTDLWLFARMR